jgi:8-oxo-dGTP pyrophosphatase MutT (NUDIX family)
MSPEQLVNIGVVSDPEAGVAVVVWRRSPEVEVLLLHRSLFGAEYDQDWAWMTPGGGRRAGEHPQVAAERELFEETGLALRCEPVILSADAVPADVDVAVFVAEAREDAEVRLSDEHDRYEWVRPEDLVRCLPAWVPAMYIEALGIVGLF